MICGIGLVMIRIGRYSKTMDLQAKLAELYDHRDPIYREIAHMIIIKREDEALIKW